ncbi:Transmembrane protein [Hirschfeldia incana]|nr:Transmembrane protein [Hirschfeldia incana]
MAVRIFLQHKASSFLILSIYQRFTLPLDSIQRFSVPLYVHTTHLTAIINNQEREQNMATLDSPLEALAFQYASFGVLAVVNNVWTWIAVVTAAVSFWRMKVITIGDNGGHPGCSLLEDVTTSKAEQEADHQEPQEMAGPVEKAAAASVNETEVWEPLMCHDGVTKGKLTMYYEVDVDGGWCVDKEGELTAVNYGGGLDDCGEWWERWEKVLRMRNGDDEWYRYVDLTVINGSVVRLWDAKRNL